MPGFRAASFLALPLAALLAGCSLVDRRSIPPWALATASNRVVLPEQRAGGGRRTFRGQDRHRHPEPGRQRRRCGDRDVLRHDRDLSGGGGTWAAAASAWLRDPAKGVREFDFLPRAAKGGGAYAVPGAVRGFYDLQTAFGTLPWQRDVAGGEAYAASGFPISHALSVRLASAQNSVRLDAALAAEFMNEAGTPQAGRHGGDQFGAVADPGGDPAVRRGRISTKARWPTQMIALFRGPGRGDFRRTIFPTTAPSSPRRA